MQDQEPEQQAPLGAGQPVLEALATKPDDEAAAELHPVGRHQRHANATPTPDHDAPPTMTKIITCECGTTLRASDDDDLVGQVQAHVEADHPDLVDQLSRDDVLAMAEEG